MTNGLSYFVSSFMSLIESMFEGPIWNTPSDFSWGVESMAFQPTCYFFSISLRLIQISTHEWKFQIEPSVVTNLPLVSYYYLSSCVYFPSSPGDSCPELKFVSWRAGTPSVLMSVVRTAPNTQHWAYLTGCFSDSIKFWRISSVPCHSVGAFPSLKSDPQFPINNPSRFFSW